MGDLLDKLKTIIDPERVSTEFDRLDELSWDALSEGRIHPLNRPPITLPLCSVQPRSTDELRSIVQLANDQRTPIVPYGGGSGLMGGALSVAPAIVVDLPLMGQMQEVHTKPSTARVQARAD
jgi:alkyldihydroxyacetonephosphate synthase